jgi:hypothetical protein
LQRIENQLLLKAKITFEMRRTTSNMFFLISNVVFEFCGRFFEEWGMLFPKTGAAPVVSDGEVISAAPGNEDFDKRKACIVFREG